MNLLETKLVFLNTLESTRMLNVPPVERYDGFEWFDGALKVFFDVRPMTGSGNRIPADAPYGTIKRIEIVVKNELKEVLKQAGIARPRKYLSTRIDYLISKDVRLIAKYINIIGTHLAVQEEVRALQEIKASTSLEKRVIRKAQAAKRSVVFEEFMAKLYQMSLLAEVIGQSEEVVNVRFANNLVARTEIGPESVMVTDVFLDKEASPDEAAKFLSVLSGLMGAR